MPDIPVVEYGLNWKTKDHKGTVGLILGDGRTVNLPVDSAEFAALAAILNESPVKYRTEDGSLFTGKEPVGGTG